MPASLCCWVQWGDDCVVYHHPSGKTHFLNAGAALLLREVLVEPKDSLTAADELAGAQGASADGRFREYVDQMLRRFDELGLVDRVAT